MTPSMKPGIVQLVILLLAGLFFNACQCKTRILVLGGTGFLGGDTLSAMLERDYEIHLLTRGNVHFASDKELTWRVQRHFFCDRDQLLRKSCKELLTSGNYDYVLDFSSFRKVQMDQMLDVLKNRVGVYVYISSDAIYEVTKKDHSGLTKEFDDRRSTNITEALRMKKDNPYGHNKLECEESLKLQRSSGGFSYVILRVADAFGPRDESMRFWIYYLWVQLHKKLDAPVSLPSDIHNKEFSLAYSKDISIAVQQIVDGNSEVRDQTLNIAFEEPITLRGLLATIGRCHGLNQIDFDRNIETAWYRFPTTTKGQIDISLAKEALEDWTPTNFHTAVEETCAYYKQAIVDPELRKERELLLASFIEDVIPFNAVKDEDYFIETLQDFYGPAVLEGIDLGFTVDPQQPRIPVVSQMQKQEL